MGPPGTGKTAVIGAKVREWAKKDARILLTAPTGNLSARMRAEFPDIEVDTCAGAFLFHRDLTEALPILTQYDMVIVDEISMLSGRNFDHIMAMYHAADKLVVLILGGDLWQLPGPHKPPSSVTDSVAWRHVRIIEFYEVFRCKDPILGDKLAALRTSIPSKKLLKHICNGHQAWTTKEPTAWDILKLMRDTDYKTKIATCTRKAAALVHDLAVKVLFKDRKKEPIGEVYFDWDTNMANFDEKGDVIEGEAPQGLKTEIYKDMKIFLTKNLNKKNDFVNGMEATIESYDHESKSLEVLTVSGKRLVVFPYTEHVEKCGNVTCMPLRGGYAGTVQRLQGMTLEHVTLWLDRAGCRAAGDESAEDAMQFFLSTIVHMRCVCVRCVCCVCVSVS